MTARQSREVTLALAHLQRTGDQPSAVAARYGVAKSSLLRAMKRAGIAVAPVGRPKLAT